MNFYILSLFPEMVTSGLNNSITGRAIENDLISVTGINIRDFSKNKHHKVDDYPYGGGAGMVMQAQPVFDAYEYVNNQIPKEHHKRVIYVTPQGKTFDQKMAQEMAQTDDLIFLCGHYEGIDERVLEEVVTDYVSIGDYVLTGGELPAMVMIDAISRLVPGVLHNDISAETESFHGGLLEHPQYSRPEVWHEKEVPPVLMSGNQREINQWRLEESVKRTKERRLDLYEKYQELISCKEVLMRQKLLHIDMIEQINRGTGVLVARLGDNILLKDSASDIYFYTACDDRIGCLDLFTQLPEKEKENISLMVIHQEEYVTQISEYFGMKVDLVCDQLSYTQREQLSITGLYRNDGKPTKQGLVIRSLDINYLEDVSLAYTGEKNDSYIRERLTAGVMHGAFIDDKLAGFIGMHDEGSIGLLYVFEEYRRRKIAMALETYMINQNLIKGWIPYGQVSVDNETSTMLQNKMGLNRAKKHVVWMEKK